MADVPCAVRQCSGVNGGLVIKNLQQWALEGYALNPTDIQCNKNALNKQGDEIYANVQTTLFDIRSQVPRAV
jgi:hypothetical protein